MQYTELRFYVNGLIKLTPPCKNPAWQLGSYMEGLVGMQTNFGTYCCSFCRY